MTDERAAYVDQMFGRIKGYAAVAVKRSETSWDERTFAWPGERAKLLAWAETNASSGNIFICPSLRQHAGRAKNDMAGGLCEWLWADVDWDKIPLNNRDSIKRKIARIGTYTVGSGSGDNVHVYVRLAAAVDSARHIVLNTGLRDYLWADNKHADNSLLRLPGTTNWKTRNGTKVRVVGGNGKARTVDALMALSEFQKVTTRDIGEVDDDWSHVDVTLTGRLRRMCAMGVDEAVGRYGSRHGAVWGVASELIKAGMTPDQVHTAMDSFPAGVDKQDTERGYSLHRDVSRRLAHHATELANVVGAVEDDDESAFEEAVEDASDPYLDAIMANPDIPDHIKALARREHEHRRARRLADEIESEQRFVRPSDDSTYWLSDAIKQPPEPEPFLIQGMAHMRANVVIVAQYKVGKTTFVMGSLIKSLVNGTPFMGKHDVPTEGRIVGHWNLEMDDRQLTDEYARPVQWAAERRVAVWGGVGWPMDITTPRGHAWAVEWLRGCGAQVWTIDSWTALAAMCNVNENLDSEVSRVTMAIDRIKKDADVDAFFMVAHTGRGENNRERLKGAVELDRWCNSRWVITKEEDRPDRFMKVEGRGTNIETTVLYFNPETREYTWGVGSKLETQADHEVKLCAEICRAAPGITKERLVTALKRELKFRTDGPARDVINDAAERGFIEIRKVRQAQHHYVIDETTVKASGGGATPRQVNMTKVSDRRHR